MGMSLNKNYLFSKIDIFLYISIVRADMLKPLNILNGTIPYSTRVNVSFIAGFTTEPI